MCYDYIDDDKFIDIVIVNQARNKFAVYFWDNHQTTFSMSTLTEVDQSNPNLTITGIIPLKDKNALMSLMIIFKTDPLQQNAKIKIFEQVKQGVFKEQMFSIVKDQELYQGVHPMFFDIDGDMDIDLLVLD